MHWFIRCIVTSYVIINKEIKHFFIVPKLAKMTYAKMVTQ